jgi:predicted RNA binding protein YcfA (HicA-like mRNA interferase family)
MNSLLRVWRWTLGQLRVLSGTEVCQILKEHGFKKVRQRGSHMVMQLKLETTTVTVPVPYHDPVKVGTLRSIIRQSGLPKVLFEV